MFNRKTLMMILSAIAAYFGLGAAGWNGNDPATVGGTGVTFNPEMIKLILTLAAAFVPQLADRFVPGLGKILSDWLDKLLNKPLAEPAPVEANGLINVSLNKDKLAAYMNMLRALKELLADHPEAMELLGKLLPIIWDTITRKPDVIPKQK